MLACWGRIQFQQTLQYRSQRNANFEEGDSCGVTGLDKGTDFLMILTGGTQALHSDSSLISETSGTATPPSSVCLRASLRWEHYDRHLKEGQSLHLWLAPGDRSGRRPWYLPAFVGFWSISVSWPTPSVSSHFNWHPALFILSAPFSSSLSWWSFLKTTWIAWSLIPVARIQWNKEGWYPRLQK